MLVDVKYASLAAYQYEKYIQPIGKSYFARMRCPICGDGKTSYKRRGYLYQKLNSLFYRCHKCGVSMSFSNFLKETGSPLYEAHRKERDEITERKNPPFSGGSFG